MSQKKEKKENPLNDLSQLRSVFGLSEENLQVKDSSLEEDARSKASKHNGRDVVRIHLQRLKGNKEATLIKGLSLDDSALKDLSTQLKKTCGVGGNAKDGEIILQGNQRNKVMQVLIDLGYKNVKLAGS